MRQNTERPEAVVAGTVKLVGTNRELIVAEAKLLLSDAAAFQAMANAVNPYGDGKLKIVLARIDTRLLHGQVATTWTKMTKPDRIIVCSDGVAQDELRKTMIIQAAPPGVHVHVVPIKKIIEIAHDTRFGNTKAMLLFETPQDMLRAIEGGVEIKEANLGSMANQ